MAAIEWLEVEGFKFSDGEAREASDLAEIAFNLEMAPDALYRMMESEELSVGRRLFFAAKVDDSLAFMMLKEPDERLCGLMRRRLDNARAEQNGGIVC